MRLLLPLISLSIAASVHSESITLQCNETLAADSTLNLDTKLDLTGRDPAYPDYPWACSIIGPDTDGPPATIVMPLTDCALAAQGEVVISGNIRFLIGTKSKQFDCCDDGESHGSIICSYSNISIAEGAYVSVETEDDNVVVSPGAFYTGQYTTVDGTVNASLKSGQMVGTDGLFSASGIRISGTGVVVASGQNVAMGAATRGGDLGTVIDGRVECSSYDVSGAGGCVLAGKYLSLGAGGSIVASDGHGIGAGCVLSTDSLLDDQSFQGTIIAKNIDCSSAGAVISGQNITLSGNALIDAQYVNASSSGSLIAADYLFLHDNAQIIVKNAWGGYGGAIDVHGVYLYDESTITCENTYAATCGGCMLASVEMHHNSSIIARNTSAYYYGAVICGGYPEQYLTVTGEATIDVDGSRSEVYGGSIFTHNISLGLDGGAFKIYLKNTASSCAAAIMTYDEYNRLSTGPLAMDDSGGGFIAIENPQELDPSMGCLNIEAYFPGPVLQPDQPCSSCADLTGNDALQCSCNVQDGSASIRECCSASILY